MNHRRIEARTRGQQHGFIRCMVSPCDPIGERNGVQVTSMGRPVGP